ncbi:heme lyase CcmF/NrfE family subunit [Blastococcus saxobsidens]|uniref:Cytochrome c-type biogenesis protein CcmF n=1 Tax=Blastococcus saxobsidens (strain DD2) TaxID=1146883 RepID=H6RQ37_BLASD|nr:heme lyase CcmF/NrfE family subunit [Blastococcus saxobsidens]CCG02806.1 Cytochrome c-type biogenesis protein CcmF [Blastococcus saxobsidens DD2]
MILAAAGWAGVMLGLASSIALAVFGFRALRTPHRATRGQLQQPVVGMVAGAAVAFIALELALLTDDFAVSFVAGNSSRATPVLFKLTAAWSALEGSIVLWVAVLAGFTAVVLRQVRSVDDRLGTGALAVMGLVATFFFGLVSTVANPFEVIAQPPADGPGPNALLQNHLLVALHPPLLYLGYVGFTVPFAFAMSALLTRTPGIDWLRRTRRANLVAWSFLSAGLVLGAWWSYEVLGWGGFWAWDPVENAALIPWLTATAFIHSAVVQVRRGILQSWNFVLVLTTFALTILGTFLTRSSVVASVHSFTQSPVGPALLGFFVVVVVGGFTLFALRAPRLASPDRLESLASREGAFLVNNLLLSLFAFVVLLGTLYPVFVEAFTGAQTSVGRPFFDRMAVPISFALLLAMGVGPFTPYRAANGRLLWSRLRPALLAGSVVSAALVVAGVRSVAVVAVALLATAIVAASARQLLTSAPDRRPATLFRIVRRQRGYWGGQISHIGLVLIALAIAVSADLSERTTATLRQGESVEFGGYTVTYTGNETIQRSHRTEVAAEFQIREGADVVRIAGPSLNQYPSQQQAVATPSVWSTPREDIYVALTSLEDGQVSVNLYRYPLMWTLWAGGLLVAAGGFWAVGGRPRRRVRDTTSAAEASAPENSDAGPPQAVAVLSDPPPEQGEGRNHA